MREGAMTWRLETFFRKKLTFSALAWQVSNSNYQKQVLHTGYMNLMEKDGYISVTKLSEYFYMTEW
jgi:hypothetical protein